MSRENPLHTPSKVTSPDRRLQGSGPSPQGTSAQTNVSNIAFTPYYRQYALLIEYKHLKTQVEKAKLGGVYVMPSFDSLLEWHGVIFLRQGMYRNGIFKFVVIIPERYPEVRPSVRFFSSVFHPLVSPSGWLDLSKEFPNWEPRKNYIVQVLQFLKRIFYHVEVDTTPANKDAALLYVNNRPMFESRARDCVEESLKHQHLSDESSSIRFTKFNDHHNTILERILSHTRAGDEDMSNLIS